MTAAAVERELRRQLRALDPAPAARPERKPRPWAHLGTQEPHA